MPKILSFLIIIVFLLVCLKTDVPMNPLFGIGILVVIGSIFGGALQATAMPVMFGLIFAGMIAGPGGLGLVGEGFTDSIILIEAICVMLMLIDMTEYAVRDVSPGDIIKHIGAGFAASIAIALITLGLLTPVTSAFNTKIILALFASTLSPLAVYSFNEQDTPQKQTMLIALGGFICSVALWGITLSFFDSSEGNTIRLAAMPIVIGVTSFVTGFAWGFIGEKVFSGRVPGSKVFLPLVLVFLFFPASRFLGLDYLFTAMGIGAYFGIVSDIHHTSDIGVLLTGLIVFTVFGVKLNIMDSLLLGRTNWIIVIVASLSMVFLRVTIPSISIRLFTKQKKHVMPSRYLIPFGPLTLIVIERFLPGFGTDAIDMESIDTIRTQCTTVILITVFVTAAYYLIVGFRGSGTEDRKR